MHEVYRRTWRFQDDLREYRAVGQAALSPSERELLHRCVLFLETDLPYEWPSLLERARRWLVPRLLVGSAARGAPEKGEPQAWPFFREQDWRLAAERERREGREA
ncbi:hypothetical protein [Myxococcus sp. RHSTA-1-4]|uniref:hypothetical protein n=1 Tax=Myxococcus sp. RHSTA-1-4 TaxID=2874601 RepID=UPI001CBE03DE|nr:hypothetical protein [Myxococcus sp. RHSTA-1-4]MBZ4423345.1 hypothetical protein [Myxococcus sp. RHSTA-1-4]